MTESLKQLARSVADRALARGSKIVLAESCTAGLVAQALSEVPGASRWLCGSAVVYRNETKTAWLGVDANQFADPSIGPVSAQTAAAMCRGVLELTPEANLAASVTGHLGPDAPAPLDGLVYIGMQTRATWETGQAPAVCSVRLTDHFPQGSPRGSLREFRQYEAALHVLRLLEKTLLDTDIR